MGIKTRLIAGGSSALVLAAALVGFYEGNHPTAYDDPVGIPTICYGHTASVKPDQTLSDARCDELLAADLGSAFQVLDASVTVPLPVNRRAALASFIYNVGAGSFKRSTLLKKLNAGDAAGACAELSRWVKADGQVLPGLVVRRAAERELCEEGL